MKNYRFILGIAVSVVLLLVIIIIMKPAPQSSQQASINSITKNVLEVKETLFDFGTISMARGKVSYDFAVKNASVNPIRMTKLYTSCMCTEAALMMNDKKVGPFGMPGHGFVPSFNESLDSGKEMNVNVVFDPAAHGPAGVGPIERVVYLETSEGVQEFGIKAMVTP